jgi:hypothetical protein
MKNYPQTPPDGTQHIVRTREHIECGLVLQHPFHKGPQLRRQCSRAACCLMVCICKGGIGEEVVDGGGRLEDGFFGGSKGVDEFGDG